MAENINVLITGCARGIGRALASAYLARPSHTVIAAVRDRGSSHAQSLSALTKGPSSNLVIVEIDSASETSALEAVKLLTSQYGITGLDIVIANAGISSYFGTALVTPLHEAMQHYRINVGGPLLLFQATAPLFLKSRRPKFVSISSGAGSIAGIEALKVENTAYGASKAALNFVTRRIHAENETIIAFVMNPGWLQTDLGNHAATSSGMKQAPLSVEEGVRKVIAVIDGATRHATSGRFMTAEGGELPW